MAGVGSWSWAERGRGGKEWYIGCYEWDKRTGCAKGVLECGDEGDGGCGVDWRGAGWVAWCCAWRSYSDGVRGGYGADG
jgi:hypothetical protein